ncbi:MAG TPA: bifunctional ornithine acetyltransferase/N-acetylglutamate synthase, partial [Anaerolineae bacterium]
MTNTPTPHLPIAFSACGVAAQIKKNGLPDVALVVSDRDCVAAALFTTNKVKAAPVLHDQSLLASDSNHLRAVVINSGCANACTGTQGMTDCVNTAQAVAQALSSQHHNPAPIDASQVFVM